MILYEMVKRLFIILRVAIIVVTVGSVNTLGQVFDLLVPSEIRTASAENAELWSASREAGVMFKSMPTGMGEVQIEMTMENGFSMYVDFGAPTGLTIEPGYYLQPGPGTIPTGEYGSMWAIGIPNAYAFNPHSPGGEGERRYFYVHEVEFLADGRVSRFAVDALNTESSIRMELRYQSPYPFTIPSGGGVIPEPEHYALASGLALIGLATLHRRRRGSGVSAVVCSTHS